MTRSFRLTAPRNADEDALHRSIYRYLRAVLPPSWIVMHTPNGGSLKGEVGRAKGLGAYAGWPDLGIYGSNEAGEGRSWFVEVKAPKGRLSDEQHGCHDKLKLLGHPVAVARSIDDARDLVREWGLPARDVAIRTGGAA